MKPLLSLGIAFLAASSLNSTLAGVPSPKITRIYPLGGQRGTSVAVEILGQFLANARQVEFDCRDLTWIQTTHASSPKLTGTLSISPQAPLGPHILRVATLEGYSTSAIFNVGQFPSRLETEPNDRTDQAQTIESLPIEIQGRMDGAADIDQYSLRVRAGERWTFDLRSIEHGSALEAKMFLFDASGTRLAYNDDRNDFDETPLLDYTFTHDGTYLLKLDQYRGPRGFNFGKNCAYILRISAMPQIDYASPAGLGLGRTTTLKLGGSALESLQNVYLTELRQAEYSRMTYPYTTPIHFRSDPPTAEGVARIEGQVVSRSQDAAQVAFHVPPDARTGLWRLWGVSSIGTSDGVLVEIADLKEYTELSSQEADWRQGEFVINGELTRSGEADVYRIGAAAGKPLHFWTLAAQIGGSHLDSVLILRDASGNRLAEDDDVVAGQGTLIGNPDSSLFFTPQHDGPLFLTVKDRTGRGGPSYPYRLKVKSERPGFQLFTTPENFTVARGDSAQLKVHLVREKGFEGEVTVWFEDLPPGVEAPQNKFRADQLFEPNADGADMIIPELTFQIQVPETLPIGDYRLRILGVATAEERSPDRRVVQAQATLLIGPLLDLWNFIRRPLPQVSMTVCEPLPAHLEPVSGTLSVKRKESATLLVRASGLSEKASIQLVNLPSGVSYQLTGRQGDQLTFLLEASPDASLGSFDISAEAELNRRRVTTPAITLSVLAANSLALDAR